METHIKQLPDTNSFYRDYFVAALNRTGKTKAMVWRARKMKWSLKKEKEKEFLAITIVQLHLNIVSQQSQTVIAKYKAVVV